MSRGKRTQYSFEDITITPIEKVVIPDTREPTLDSVWWLKNMTAAKLTLRERIILILQYGLRGGNPQALSDIAKIVEGLEGQAPSKEGLKKLRDSALRKLRNYLKD
jgi:DNA-directed RNA polymerase sigma subunit (sigma70/sigma32)